MYASGGPISVLAQKWGKEALFRTFWCAMRKESAIFGIDTTQNYRVRHLPADQYTCIRTIFDRLRLSLCGRMAQATLSCPFGAIHLV